MKIQSRFTKIAVASGLIVATGAAVLAKSRFDLAVLDVMMPFADGLTVCREARHRGL